MLLPNVNPLLVAGGPALSMARQSFFGANRLRNPMINPNRRAYGTMTSPSRQIMSGQQKRQQLVNYHFGGQAAFYGGNQSSTGGGTAAKWSQFTLSDPTASWMMTGKISPEDMNIARNKAMQAFGAGSGQLGWGSGEYGAQDETMAQMPKGYYVGFGSKMKTVGDNKTREYLAKRYGELRQYGYLGPEPYAERNKEIGRMLTDLRERLAHGSWYGYGSGSMETMTVPHRRPDAPGMFVLGHGQGMRVRAWERRQIAKAEEAKRDDLKVAADKGDAIQQESQVMKPAQETERR